MQEEKAIKRYNRQICNRQEENRHCNINIRNIKCKEKSIYGFKKKHPFYIFIKDTNHKEYITVAKFPGLINMTVKPVKQMLITNE